MNLSRANAVEKKSGHTLSANVEQPPLSSEHIGRVEVTWVRHSRNSDCKPILGIGERSRQSAHPLWPSLRGSPLATEGLGDLFPNKQSAQPEQCFQPVVTAFRRKETYIASPRMKVPHGVRRAARADETHV